MYYVNVWIGMAKFHHCGSASESLTIQ